MTITSMLPSSMWSRLSPGLQVMVTGGGVYSAAPASSNMPTAPPFASGRTSATSSLMYLAICPMAQS